MKTKTTLMAAIFIAAIQFTSSATAAGLDGVDFVITNMFQGNSTNNVETDVAAFGLNNNLFSNVREGTELPRFITLYDVNVSSDSVTFDWVESDFSKKVGGVMPDDKHDRNYFVFDLPSNMEIKSVTFDQENSNLLDGSALPTVTLISRNKFMTEFAKGVIRVDGFKPSFKIVTGPAQ